MRGGRNVVFYMMVMAVIVFSVTLGRNLWGQYREQAAFASLRQEVERGRERDKERMEIMAESETGAEEREILPEYESLAKENPDFVGWISIEGTKIDYPVMQVIGDREYYLHRNFEGEDSYVGVPFVGNGDLRQDSGNVFIYGHNMRNGTMFADLLKYQQKDFWEQHPMIALDTLYEHQKYEVFTAFYTNEREWQQENGSVYAILRNDKITGSEHIVSLIEDGFYDTGIIPEIEIPLLFLVTCSYQEKGGRFIVGGVKIE